MAITEILRFGELNDVPAHTSAETSSIGGTWPPERSSHKRTKAFFPEIINSTETVDRFSKSLSGFLETLSPDNSRIQFRAIIELDTLQDWINTGTIPGQIEAVMQLDSGKFGKNPILVYFGANHPTRMSDHNDRIRIEQNIELALYKSQKNASEIFERPSQNGIIVETLNLDDYSNPDELYDQFVLLYKRFGFSRDDVIELIHSESNTFAIAKKDGQIVSAAIAERASIPVGNTTLEMVEITEAATSEEFQNLGLYTAVSTQLFVALANADAAVDLVFGECNGLSTVLSTSVSQGRELSLVTASRLNIPSEGILVQQVPIEGVDRNTVYNDLVPTYMTGSRLEITYRQQ